MKKIAAIVITICMAVTGTCTGIPQMAVPGGDMTVSAASYPALKTISYKATGNQREDIIGFAKTQVGYTEKGSNNTYFGSWFGCNYNPWCAMFVCWCAAKAGVATNVIPRLATADRSWAKKQGVYYKSKYWGGSYTPKKGDLIYFSWSVKDWADHIGMVSGTGKKDGKTYVYTIEGNKHDKVTEGSYVIDNRYILGYASPKYVTSGKTRPTTTAPTTTTAPKDAATGKTYTLRYRDGLDTTSNDEEDRIIPPLTGTFGQDLTLSNTRFQRSGYVYNRWDVYRADKNDNLIYLCKDTATGNTEKWYKKSSIPSNYKQVTVECGRKLNIKTSVSGTVYVSPIWKKGDYTITYRSNGGSGAPSGQAKTKGKAVTLKTKKPTRQGYIFQGWATSKTASKAEYASGASYTKDATVTLYAVWKSDGSTVASQKGGYDTVTTDGVNTRSGPGANYQAKGTIDAGTTVHITEVSNDWGKLSDGRWIALSYTSRENSATYTLEYTDGVDATTNDSSIIKPVTASYAQAVTVSGTKFTRSGYHYSKWKVYRLKDAKKLWYCRDTSTGTKEGWYADNAIASGYTMFQVSPGSQMTISTSVGDRIFITPVWEADQAAVSYKARTKQKVNRRKGPGKTYDKVGTLPKGKNVTIVEEKNGWGKLKKSGYWIHLKKIKKINPPAPATTKATTKAEAKNTASAGSGIIKVKVTAKNGVNVRSGPGKTKELIRSYEKGKNLKIKKIKNGWGKLRKSGNWINLKYTKIVSGYRVQVTAADLNQRKGPGTKHDVVGTIPPGTYDISKVNGHWGKVRSTGYWVYLPYTKRVK